MIPLHLLEDSDVILSSDYVRQLGPMYEGHLQTTSTYGGSRINRFGWMTAEEVIPAWIGRTVGELHAAMNKLKHAYPPFEIIRGKLPASHLEN